MAARLDFLKTLNAFITFTTCYTEARNQICNKSMTLQTAKIIYNTASQSVP